MYDLIVVGGGPSGASAAEVASEKGLSVLLIEKEKFPRNKPCGGALSGRALYYLQHIPGEVILNEVYGAKICYNGSCIEVQKDDSIAFLTSRDIFDKFLLERAASAGAEICVDKVIDFEEERDRVRVKSETGGWHCSRFLIIAEGARGNLKHKIRSRDHKNRCSLGVVAEVSPVNFNKDSKSIELHFGVAPMGYGWIFPAGKYYSVGIIGIASRLKGAKKIFYDFLSRNNFSLHGKLRGHMVPLGGFKRRLTGNRALLCGDAAGFVDPFSGEGISYAIRSGQIAAEVVAGALQRENAPNLSVYHKACSREFNDNLKYSLIMSKIVSRYPGKYFNLISANRKVLHDYLDVPVMKKTYKSFLISLFKIL